MPVFAHKDSIGMELAASLVHQDQIGMVSHVSLAPLGKFGTVLSMFVNAPLDNNGMEPTVLLLAPLV